MIREALNQFPMIELTIFGLILFFLAFGVILYFAFKKENQPFFERMSRLPVEDEGMEVKR